MGSQEKMTIILMTLYSIDNLISVCLGIIDDDRVRDYPFFVDMYV